MAGQAKRRRQRFFAEHPKCCFCAGESDAVQEDHLPPRSMFLGRHVPEGYVFPACAACNQGSRYDDRLFSFLACAPAVGEQRQERNQHWLKLGRSIKEDHPDLLRKASMSVNQKRAAAKRFNLEPLPGQSYGEQGMMRIPSEMSEAAQKVLTKLAKALHYRYARKIVPRDAVVKVYQFSNAEVMAGKFPYEFIDGLPGVAEHVRNAKDLGDQFSCFYGTSEDGNVGAYICGFGAAMVAALLVFCDGDVLKGVADELVATYPS